MIIVEGPDNSGKSTLVKGLVEHFGLKLLKPNKKGPPKSQEDIYNNTKYIISGALNHPNNKTIVDRFSLIGESIYGPICRGRDLWVSCFDKKMKMYSILRTIDPFFIYCRPPNSIVLDMSSHELKSYDTPEHIEKVEKNKALILQAYDNYFGFFRAYNFFKYDYTDPNSYHNLIERLKEYTKW